jgi:hypothetical protein
MIRGNMMDVFTIAFENGEQFSLVAKDKKMAQLIAYKLIPGHKIIAIHKTDEWEESA